MQGEVDGVIPIGPRTFFIPHDGMAKCPPPDLPAKAVALPSMSNRLRPLARIQATVALSYDITTAMLVSPYRWRKAAWPRQVAMYLARNLTNHSLPSIGRHFGNRDHSTVIHACRAVEKRMASDPLYRADVEALREALS